MVFREWHLSTSNLLAEWDGNSALDNGECLL